MVWIIVFDRIIDSALLLFLYITFRRVRERNHERKIHTSWCNYGDGLIAFDTLSEYIWSLHNGKID